jgi:hypothetical protein
LAVLVAAIFFASPAMAQSVGGNGYTAPNSSTQTGAAVVSACGNQTYTVGHLQPTTQDTSGAQCTNASSGSTALGAGSAIIGKISTVDSAGNDATDTTNHAIRVNAVAGGVAQGSTTSGQSGSLVMCATTTSAPSNTTAQTNSVSCDTSGNVRGTNPAVGATAAAVPASANYLGAQASAVLKGVTQCDTHAFYDASDNGKKTVVAGVSAKKIYICGFVLATGSTATNLSLTSGTGSDCASTSTAITPAYQLIANDRVGANAAFWNGLVTLANADNLCVNASAGNAHQVEVFYTVQ